MTNTSATGGYLAPTSGPIDDVALLVLIQGAIVGITGLPSTSVYPRWQAEPPNLPAVATNWVAFGIPDRDQDTFAVEWWDPETGHTLIRHETLNVLASFYGPGCDGLAMTLREGFGVAQNREALSANGLEFISSGKPQRAPDLLKGQWVTRIDLPFSLRREIDRTYPVLSLLSGNITVQADSITETITVSSNEATK